MTAIQTENKGELSDNEEIAKLMAELAWEPTEEMIQESVDAVLRGHEDEQNRTMLYDPTDKEYRSYAICKKRYGEKMADKIFRAKTEGNGRISKEDYAELMRIARNGKNLNHAKNKTATKEKSVPNSFIMLNHSTLRSPTVLKALRKTMMPYLYLRTYIVRKPFKGDKLNLHEKYFKKGKLASSVSIRKIASECGLNPKTIQSYLKQMSEAKIIQIEKISAREAYDNQQHNVFVCGTHDHHRKEHYFIEELDTVTG